MNLFLIIILLGIFIETSYNTIKIHKPTLVAKNRKREVYIDTSAIMDGRILQAAKTGFLGDELIIPRSVIRELQLLADGKDNEKRSRARFGLDVVNELERVELASVSVFADPLDRTPVDERLIQLAKTNHGLICTNDYNLNKVATAEGIDVLNINDLALALRAEYLPGETFTVKITSVGSNPKQGVGHLPDGTMVVVDNASKRVGKDLDVEFLHFHQTSAGRMMFAKIVQKNTNSPKKKSKK